jgi:hypothetical protein
MDQSVSSAAAGKKTASDSKKTRKEAEEDAKVDDEGKDGTNKYMDEEEMLDIAEHCFIRMAECLIEKGRTARSVFLKYSLPEQFPDGTVLELLSPLGFLEGVREASGGLDGDLSEMEAACLLRVLAKPELDNAIILNEFTMIMENFGVPDLYGDEEEAMKAREALLAAGAAAMEEEDDDEDDFDDYVRDEDYLMEEEEQAAPN